MNDDSQIKATKLLIDDSSNFGFHAAYLVYSKAWAENEEDGIRIELNNLIQSLADNQEDYSTFYQKINQYRKNISGNYVESPRFKSQKKRAWRKNQAKKIRISRHKK